MELEKIGISDIGFYIPRPRMTLKNLVEQRSKIQPELKKYLEKALRKTGQNSFSFPEIWEDTASMAANAASTVLDRISDNDQRNIRYITVGTETAVDHAKPVASYLQGMLRNAGYSLTTALSTFDVKHACAGGTAALLSCSSMLSAAGNQEEKALVVTSDIARYEEFTTAELTQGAGSTALIVEKNPKLIDLDIRNTGFYSSDVDDFFRPLESNTARVRGGYSMKCYQESFEEAFSDYCSRLNKTVDSFIEDYDYIVPHVPFPVMPEIALRKLLKNLCKKDSTFIEHFLEKTRFLEALHLNRVFGNLYTGSIFTYLAALLKLEQERIGNQIVGKKILMVSYGSGNTMMIFSGRIAADAPSIIRSWPANNENGQNVPFEQYEKWMKRSEDINGWRKNLEKITPEKGQFFLKGFAENGLRLYERI